MSFFVAIFCGILSSAALAADGANSSSRNSWKWSMAWGHSRFGNEFDIGAVTPSMTDKNHVGIFLNLSTLIAANTYINSLNSFETLPINFAKVGLQIAKQLDFADVYAKFGVVQAWWQHKTSGYGQGIGAITGFGVNINFIPDDRVRIDKLSVFLELEDRAGFGRMNQLPNSPDVLNEYLVLVGVRFQY